VKLSLVQDRQTRPTLLQGSSKQNDVGADAAKSRTVWTSVHAGCAAVAWYTLGVPKPGGPAGQRLSASNVVVHGTQSLVVDYLGLVHT
jgi:hypothetical protein